MKKRIKNVKRCKTYRYPSEFLKTGRELKSCQVCRNIATTSRLKHSHYRCEHGRSKYRCIECGGSSICEHKTQRSVCKTCGESQIWVHKRQRIQCKICGDEIKITLKNMIKNSKRSDQEHDRYDANNFIDMCFLEGLVEEYPHCYWDDCDITLCRSGRMWDRSAIGTGYLCERSAREGNKMNSPTSLYCCASIHRHLPV